MEQKLEGLKVFLGLSSSGSLGGGLGKGESCPKIVPSSSSSILLLCQLELELEELCLAALIP